MHELRVDGRVSLIDGEALARHMHAVGLAGWADVAPQQLRRALHDAPHGDWPRWRDAITALPTLGPGRIGLVDGALGLEPVHDLPDETVERLRQSLQQLHPWRKGPYRIAGITIDTEWRSDWKWDRIKPHLEDLTDRVVLDVGCGNGYHAWRAALDGARLVIGIDPVTLFLAQFLAIRRLLEPMDRELAQRVHLQPIGIESLPKGLHRFDTVMSMGVLYHRRAPIDHLTELHEALRPGGQLVLETLVIQGAGHEVLVPPGRYAKMRNVWFIPSTAQLEIWLRRIGFVHVRTVDETVTSTEEQRATDWMTFESLADFLDPADSRFTIEGHPAPRRAIVIAETNQSHRGTV